MPARTSLPRVLFILDALARETLSAEAFRAGREALSGSQGSCVLVADGLARRGHEVGIAVRRGATIHDTPAQTFREIAPALQWLGEGRAVSCYWGGTPLPPDLRTIHQRLYLWAHIDLTTPLLQSLERGDLAGIITTSDLARLAVLYSSFHRRIGRVHNPLHPAYDRAGGLSLAGERERYESRALLFVGYLGENKGAHIVLQWWPRVRTALPDATLTLAGSVALYDSSRTVGPLGVASPAFEEQYLAPIARQFGSLAAAGVRLVGTVPPTALRAIYDRAALGVINPSWDTFTETFSCAGVEMLACGLPVFSVARGALPETLASKGAVLLTRRELLQAPERLASVLRDAEQLRARAAAGAAYARSRYALDTILDHWEALMAAEADGLDRASGPWSAPHTVRYAATRMAAHLHLGRAWGGLRAVREASGRRRS